MTDPMFNPSQGPARANIDHLDPREIDRLQRANAIVSELDRRRPRYFDGRFLAAPDLAREQDYFLTRQADLARASTAGVIHGLQVSRVDNTTVQIQPGNGVTPAGELVVLSTPDGLPLSVDLADVAGMQLLDAAFALDTIPNEPPRRRSGLFVLALRPVEYTANPIAAYPASITERRTIEDGEIIEAVAVTLIPYPDDQAGLTPQRQRAHAAGRIFVDRPSGAIPAEALPIAMMQLDRGFVLWVDSYMVRREVGAEHGGVAGFGPVPRSVREAQVHQYNGQLADVIAEKGTARFAAAEIFRALPAAGQLPIETIEGKVDAAGHTHYTQLYFPPQVRVLMSIVPEDEIAAHVEEALLLPPIDLTATSEALGFTWVLILLPAKRGDLFFQRVMRAVEVAPAAPDIVTRGQSLQVLGKLFPSPPPAAPAPPASPPAAGAPPPVLDNAFKVESAAHNRLWYVRRRALRAKPEHRYEVKPIDVGYLPPGVPR